MTEPYILETQKVLGNLIKKPKLVEKLLAKPPFRFIHDITKSVIIDTGYLDGMFSEDELNADNIQVFCCVVCFEFLCFCVLVFFVFFVCVSVCYCVLCVFCMCCCVCFNTLYRIKKEN
jgi:Microtubule-binding protein MIP-T3 CH-like domain